MGFSRQEYQSGLPFPSSGDLPDPGIESGSLALQADSVQTELRSHPSNAVQSEEARHEGSRLCGFPYRKVPCGQNHMLLELRTKFPWAEEWLRGSPRGASGHQPCPDS